MTSNPDTIAAVATGNVISAIGILRVSGADTLSVIDRVFFPLNGHPMSEAKNRQLVYGTLKDADGAVLDLCLCTISRAPNSYTGEDTAELQCHGSPTVLRAGLQALFAAGARQALAGEFSKRAFLNGRMDLTQAEAVIDLIHSETEEAAKNAAGQLGGAVLRQAQPVYDLLRDIASHFHAVIDYPDEDIPEFQMQAYEQDVSAAVRRLETLLRTFDRGRVLRGGLPAAILGRPNVGKSSLINMLTGNSRLAKTSQTPGKTQLVNHFLINDSWYLVDLPGYGFAKLPDGDRARLRHIIWDYINHSEELVMLMVLLDSRHDMQDIDLRFISELGEKGIPFGIIFTKADKQGPEVLQQQIEKNKERLLEDWEELPPVFVSSSVKGTGKEEILTYLESILKSL